METEPPCQEYFVPALQLRSLRYGDVKWLGQSAVTELGRRYGILTANSVVLLKTHSFLLISQHSSVFLE